MDDKSKADMIGHYSGLLEKHGTSKEALDYKSSEQQTKRYAALADIEPIGRECSVLDVGCGLGYLCDFMRSAGWLGMYTGIDINPGMIAASKERLPTDKFICGDILADELPQNYDYVMCGATVEHRPKFAEPEKYLHDMIRRMFSLANKGVAFDVFSNRVDYMDDDKLYANPVSLLTFCYGLTRRLTLRNDCRPYELIVYLYTDGPTDRMNIYSEWATPVLNVI